MKMYAAGDIIFSNTVTGLQVNVSDIFKNQKNICLI